MLRGALCALLLGVAIAAVLQWRPDLLAAWRAAERFNGEAAMADVRQIVGDGTPRVAGTPGARAGRDRIVALLAAGGITAERHETIITRSVTGPGLTLENLMARIPGTRGDGTAPIALVAHSDSAPGAPGAGDDASGVACVVGIARALQLQPPVHDILLLITDGEERGLLGAQAFMAQDERALALRAVVNLDARGASGPAYVFETGPQTAWLSQLMAQVLTAPRTQSLAVEAYRRMPNGTDFTVFLRAGATGFNVAFIGDVAAYHTALDTPERLQPSTVAHMGQTALELLRGLDAQLPAAGQPIGQERAVFGDIAGLWILRWPEEHSLAITAAGAFLVLAAGAWQLIARARERAVRLPGRAAAASLAAAVCVLAGSAGVAWCLGAAAKLGGITMANAPLRVGALNFLAWAGAGAMVTGAAALLLRRLGAGVWDALLGVWLLWGVLAGVAAVLVPAISLPLTVPVVCVGVASVLAPLGMRWAGGGEAAERRDRAGRWVALVGVAAAALVWVPLEPSFVDAFGMGLAPFNGLRAGLVLLTLLPLVVGTVTVRESAALG